MRELKSELVFSLTFDALYPSSFAASVLRVVTQSSVPQCPSGPGTRFLCPPMGSYCHQDLQCVLQFKGSLHFLGFMFVASNGPMFPRTASLQDQFSVVLLPCVEVPVFSASAAWMLMLATARVQFCGITLCR